jgi:death on curing protein
MATEYLTLDDILYIHTEQLRLYGGASGVRDEGLVLSALFRPQTGFYSDVVEEAAALWESLTMNHGFIDGNKRVAFASMIVFLQINGVRVVGDQEEAIVFIYRSIEADTFRKDALRGWLQAHSVPLG